MTFKNDCCFECIYAKLIDENIYGRKTMECHRSPPNSPQLPTSAYGTRFGSNSKETEIGKWPLVYSESWCGEFKIK